MGDHRLDLAELEQYVIGGEDLLDQALNLGPLADKRVLQLGCDTAQSLVAMARQGARVIAIDDSPDLVERARRVCDREEVRLELKRADLADLAFQRVDGGAGIDTLVLRSGTSITIFDLDGVLNTINDVDNFSTINGA